MYVQIMIEIIFSTIYEFLLDKNFAKPSYLYIAEKIRVIITNVHVVVKIALSSMHI